MFIVRVLGGLAAKVYGVWTRSGKLQEWWLTGCGEHWPEPPEVSRTAIRKLNDGIPRQRGFWEGVVSFTP